MIINQLDCIWTVYEGQHINISYFHIDETGCNFQFTLGTKYKEHFYADGAQGRLFRLIESGEYQGKAFEVYEEVKNFEWK